MDVTLGNLADLSAIATAIAVSLSAATGFLIWIATRNSVSKRAALDIIKSHLGDNDWITADKEYREIHKTADEAAREKNQDFEIDVFLQKFARPENRFSEERSRILKILNRYEMIAVGIRQGSIDEKTYKLWYRSSVLAIFSETILFVKERQLVNPQAYRQFHWLAYRWATDSEQIHIHNTLGTPDLPSMDALRALNKIGWIIDRWRLLFWALLLLIVFALGTLL